MTDAEELLERIRKAREWADEQADTYRRKAEARSKTEAGDRALALIFVAVSQTLDKILEPEPSDE